jgi:hypothetical protein
MDEDKKRCLMKNQNWLQTHWRPMMAYVYMFIVIFDFVLGPIFWSIVQLYGGQVTVQWMPLTLQSGGIFHAAMGAILGISAFSRGKEKIEAIKNNYYEGGNEEDRAD